MALIPLLVVLAMTCAGLGGAAILVYRPDAAAVLFTASGLMLVAVGLIKLTH